MKTQGRSIVLVIVLLLIIGAIAYLEETKAGPSAGTPSGVSDDIPIATSTPTTITSTSTAMTVAARNALIAQKATQYPRAKEIVDPTGFINTPEGSLGASSVPVTIAQYIGKKVILLDFWTYSCINCQRTLPYLTTWYKEYEDKGLVIIGIHTPEFDFEKDINNVTAATKEYGITYPVVLDSNYGTWDAYQNQYWPHEYLIDVDGFIREDHIGEGGYTDTETMIQTLLTERAQELGLTINIPSTPTVVNPANQMLDISPETYFGAERNVTFMNGTAGQTGTQALTLPTTFTGAGFYLGGSWDFEQQYAQNTGEADVVFPFYSKYVYIVASANTPTDVTVSIDGKPVGTLAGSDVVTKNGQSVVTISGSKLYNIVSLPNDAQHTLELHIPNAGVQVFTLTFGS
ncbi:MAG TPA: redoxin domain-containing protein [Candidatus Paceibacterota bacterium]|nr:redoxin domain-containing protein [Candidatus Paceibacterota bacterium]